MADRLAAQATVDDHIRKMLDLMKRGAHVSLTDIPDDPTFLMSHFSGSNAKEMAEKIEAKDAELEKLEAANEALDVEIDSLIRELESERATLASHTSALAEKDGRIAEFEAALEKIANATARCEHDGGFDREIGPIGCNLGDKCLCIGIHPIARDALTDQQKG